MENAFSNCLLQYSKTTKTLRIWRPKVTDCFAIEHFGLWGPYFLEDGVTVPVTSDHYCEMLAHFLRPKDTDLLQGHDHDDLIDFLSLSSFFSLPLPIGEMFLPHPALSYFSIDYLSNTRVSVVLLLVWSTALEVMCHRITKIFKFIKSNNSFPKIRVSSVILTPFVKQCSLFTLQFAQTFRTASKIVMH